jgi:hypothetical protein
MSRSAVPPEKKRIRGPVHTDDSSERVDARGDAQNGKEYLKSHCCELPSISLNFRPLATFAFKRYQAAIARRAQRQARWNFSQSGVHLQAIDEQRGMWKDKTQAMWHALRRNTEFWQPFASGHSLPIRELMPAGHKHLQRRLCVGAAWIGPGAPRPREVGRMRRELWVGAGHC